MAVSNINVIINKDIHKVWDIVFAVEKYSEWRSDLSKTEIINEKQFIEYTKDGYATKFSITTIEPYKRWEFDMENSNMSGHWIGIFTAKGNETQIDFTENVTPKKWIMKPFVKIYLKKATRTICSGLKKSIGITTSSLLFHTHRVNLPRTFTTKYPPPTQRHTEQEI